MEGYGSRFLEDTFGISGSSLHYWDSTGLLKPSLRPAAGRGSKRLYSFRDVVQLLVVVRLREIGISLQRVRKCLVFLRKHFPEVEAPLAEISLVTDGETIFTLTQDADKLLDTIREQVVWTVPISSLIRSARGKIESATVQETARVRVDRRTFSVTLERDPEDGWWIGLVPELPGCGSQGSTVEELKENLVDAIREYLAVRGAHGEDAEATEANAAAV